MSIDSTWLRCPNCFADLETIDPRTLGCANGHRFDVARNGSVTLLPPRAPRTIGDDRAMLEARARLLGSGAYAPISEGLAGLLAAETARGVPVQRLIDFGCGTGYYAAAVRASLGAGPTLLTDRSPDAVRMSLRTMPDATGVVLDLWRPLPVRDGVAAVALCVFAPRNPTEFARVLRRGGLLAVVVPTPAHLRELREGGAMLDVPSGKSDDVALRFRAAGLELRAARPIEYGFEADAEQRSLMIAMGPSAHHQPREHAESSPGVDGLELTVSVDVLLFART